MQFTRFFRWLQSNPPAKPSAVILYNTYIILPAGMTLDDRRDAHRKKTEPISVVHLPAR